MVVIDTEVVLIVSLICVTALGVGCLFMDKNGTALNAIIAAIVTIAGYLFAKSAIKVKVDQDG